MAMVELNDQQWGQVMALLSEAPWKVANPLLMAIGDQLRLQYAQQQPAPPVGMRADGTPPPSMRVDGNSKEQANE